MCKPGTFQNQTGQTECLNCEKGFTTSKMKDKCDPCAFGTFSIGIGKDCDACTGPSDCPCMKTESPCFNTSDHSSLCINTGSNNFRCLSCPPGYEGDGITCTDVDEVINTNILIYL